MFKSKSYRPMAFEEHSWVALIYNFLNGCHFYFIFISVFVIKHLMIQNSTDIKMMHHKKHTLCIMLVMTQLVLQGTKWMKHFYSFHGRVCPWQCCVKWVGQQVSSILSTGWSFILDLLHIIWCVDIVRYFSMLCIINLDRWWSTERIAACCLRNCFFFFQKWLICQYIEKSILGKNLVKL